MESHSISIGIHVGGEGGGGVGQWLQMTGAL